MSGIDPQVLAKALGGEVHGQKVLAPGPGHSLADRSLSVLVEGDDFIVHSFAGDDPLVCKDYVRQKAGLPEWEPSRPKNGGASGIARKTRAAEARADCAPRIVAEYVYVDADERPSRKIVRTSDKQFPQSRWTGTGWKSGVKGVPLYPYRLPEMLAAVHRAVFICEGEKDADRLASLGFVATTNPMGAGSWKAELNSWFKGRDCYILADNDEPGRKHADDVARHLEPVAASVRIVALPGLPLGGDVSDWLDADPARQETLVEVARACPLWKPGAAASDNDQPRPKVVSGFDLAAMEFPPLGYVVPGYIVEGCTLLAGRPKLGKSWLCLDMALSVASGGTCLGTIRCEKGDVLYLALEDNARRLKTRINRLCQLEALAGAPVPKTIDFATEWPRANEGGIDFIAEWIGDHPAARLVIVDVLAMFKPRTTGKETLYEADYSAIKGLQALAADKGVAIVIVHHTRKSGSDVDPFEKVSGTLGLSGAADSVMILDGDQNGITLYGRGRDIEEIETAVRFDRMTCKWVALGQAAEVRRTDERAMILEAMDDHCEPMSAAEIADTLGENRTNIRQLLFKMAKAGEVMKAGRGRFVHPDHAAQCYRSQSMTPDHNDNSDNNIPRTHRDIPCGGALPVQPSPSGGQPGPLEDNDHDNIGDNNDRRTAWSGRVIDEALDLLRGTTLDTSAYRDRIKSFPPNEQIHAARRDLSVERQRERAKRRRKPGKPG